MRFTIEGRDYDVADLGKFSLLDLLDLRRQTGLDIDTISKRLDEMGTLFEDDPSAMLSSEPHLEAFGAFIWLLRRRAGERLTLEESLDFPLDELTITLDPDEVEATDPR